MTSPHFEVLRKMKKEQGPQRLEKALVEAPHSLLWSLELGAMSPFLQGSGGISAPVPWLGQEIRGHRGELSSCSVSWLLINPKRIRPCVCGLSHYSIRLASHVGIIGS